MSYNINRYQLEGWFHKKNAKWYQDHAKNIHDGLIVEIGVFGGVSLMNIAGICKENNTKIIGIDPWELTDDFNGHTPPKEVLEKKWGERIARKKKLDQILKELEYDHVELIKGFSAEESKKIQNDSVDFVFIDGNHTYFNVLEDLESWLPKMTTTGILSGHDYQIKEIQKAIQTFCDKYKFTFKVIAGNCWEIIR